MQPTHFEPNLWVGNLDDGTNFDWLRREGIQNIVNLTGLERGQRLAGFETLLIDQRDCEPIARETLRRFFGWMRAREGSVIIHCRMGISRASSFTIAWLMDLERPLDGEDFWSAVRRWDRIEDRLRAARPWIRPHYELKKSILDYFSEVSQ